MAEDNKKEEQGFRVSDRRRFTEAGESRPEASPAGEPRAGEQAEAERKEPGSEPEPTREGPRDLPEINFATFVFSLSSSVLIHLGEAPDPLTGEKKKDLAMAKQTIDILSMLKDKTQGNLSDDESRLMEGILYDLRMRYVSESKSAS